jgi:hypothetical protein
MATHWRILYIQVVFNAIPLKSESPAADDLCKKIDSDRIVS